LKIPFDGKTLGDSELWHNSGRRGSIPAHQNFWYLDFSSSINSSATTSTLTLHQLQLMRRFVSFSVIPLTIAANSHHSAMQATDYPAATKQADAEIDGVLTYVTSTVFLDKIMITITQGGRLAQWVTFHLPLCV